MTLIRKNLADKIGLKGQKTHLRLQGLNDTTLSDSNALKGSCLISPYPDGRRYEIRNLFILRDVRLPVQTVTALDIQHLGPGGPSPYDQAEPGLLIGQDNWRLIATAEQRDRGGNLLAAARTKLGWVAHGCKGAYPKLRNFCSVRVVTGMDREDARLHELVKEYFSLESLGIRLEGRTTASEDRIRRILNQTTRFVGDRWETGLLWRKDEVNLANNYEHARSRLQAVERKLDTDQQLAKLYYAEMDRLFATGYAEVIEDEEEPEGRTWYLPHFGVTNPNKPGKLRLVFDGAAKYKDRSLNDHLSPGLDLLKPLVVILLNFRNKQVAFAGDIKDMFMRVQITRSDRDAQRFLYRGKDRVGPPKKCRMISMVFGSTCSPCSAIYVRDRNADEFAEGRNQSAYAIKNNTYIDDYLDSEDNPEEAIQRITEVVAINKKAGFEMHKWASNSKQVNRKFGEGTRPGPIDISDKTSERVLGMQ